MMTKFFHKFQEPYFWPIVIYGGKKIFFFQRIRLLRATSFDPISRKLLDGQTNKLKDPGVQKG